MPFGPNQELQIYLVLLDITLSSPQESLEGDVPKL